YPPLHVMAAQPSDSKQSLVSKTGDHRPFSYSASLGGSMSSTSTSLSSSSLNSATGSMVPPSSQTGSVVNSLSDVSIVSATGSAAPSNSNLSIASATGSVANSNSDLSIASTTGLSIPSVASSISNLSVQSETGSNASRGWPADDKTDTSTEGSEKISGTGPTSRTPSISDTSLASKTFSGMSGTSSTESSLESKTFSPMGTSGTETSLKSKTFTPMSGTSSTDSSLESKTFSGMSDKTDSSDKSLVSKTFSPMPNSSSTSSSLVSQTMSPLKEETMKEITPPDGKASRSIVPPSPAPITSATSLVSQTGASVSAKPSNTDLKSPIDNGHTSVRSPSPKDCRKDINVSSQTPVREKAKDFSQRSAKTVDSSLFQPSGKYDTNGEFSPADQTLDDVPEIPTEKSPPLRTATESMSSTSLAINDTVPDRIYGDDEELGAKCDKMFVGRMTLKKNKKNEASFEFEGKSSIDNRSKSPLVARKLKVTNVFGGVDRKYVPPERKKIDSRKTTVPPPVTATPAKTDDSRAHITTDQRMAPSLPLSLTKKSEREGTVSASKRVESSSSGSWATSSTASLTNISLLKTESLPPSTAKEPTRSSTVSPVAQSPVVKRKKNKRSKKKKEEEAKTPRERVVYREHKIEPTIGTPNRKWKIPKKSDTVDKSPVDRSPVDRSKKERERTTKNDKKKKSEKRVVRDRSNQTGEPFYQQLVYSSYVTNGLNVARYNYDERAEKKTTMP
ncbi:hypothetical protein PFISCL1PPCAC_24216, partial [Pristionchus fissidentatus]